MFEQFILERTTGVPQNTVGIEIPSRHFKMRPTPRLLLYNAYLRWCSKNKGSGPQSRYAPSSPSTRSEKPDQNTQSVQPSLDTGLRISEASTFNRDPRETGV